MAPPGPAGHQGSTTGRLRPVPDRTLLPPPPVSGTSVSGTREERAPGRKEPDRNGGAAPAGAHAERT